MGAYLRCGAVLVHSRFRGDVPGMRGTDCLARSAREEAVSALWLAEALREAGDHARAQAAAEAALGVFEELRSVRELDHVGSRLASLR